MKNNNITKTSLEVLPKQSNIAGSFWLLILKKVLKHYKSVISITFISNIIPHMLAISICNKDNG